MLRLLRIPLLILWLSVACSIEDVNVEYTRNLVEKRSEIEYPFSASHAHNESNESRFKRDGGGTVNVNEPNELRARAITEHHASDSEYHVDTVTAVRQKRAGSDPFTEFHSKMTLAARIFSGIALRIGIHDGSVTGDEVISELLNLKSISLDDVENYDKSKVDQFFRDLTKLNLAQSATLKQLEEKIGAMNSLREQYEEIADPDETQSINAHMDKIEAFKNGNVDFGFMVNLNNYVASAIPILDTIANGQTSTMSQLALGAFAEQLDRFWRLSSNITSVLAALDGHKELMGDVIFESSTVKDVQLLKTFYDGSFGSIGSTTPREMNDQLALLNGLTTQFGAAAPSIRVTDNIIRSMRSPRTPSGFVNGFPDVLQLSNDVHDTWLPTVIDKYDKELIRSELQPLDQFRSSFSALEATWKGLGGSDISQVSVVTELFDRSRAPIADSVFAAMESKAAPTDMNVFAAQVYELVDDMLKFREILNTVIAKLTTIGKSEDMAKLKELIQFKDKIHFDNGRTVQDVARDMPKKEEVNKLIDVLNALKPKIKDIEEMVTGTQTLPTPLIASLPSKIESQRGVVATFLGDQTKIKFFQYFDFIKSIKSELTSLSEAVTLIQTVRSMKSSGNFQSTLTGITDKIAGSIADFRALRAVPAKIKSMSTPMMDELVQLKKIQGPAKTFGEAVAVLDTAQKILAQQPDIEKMISDGWAVPALFASHQNKEQLAKDWADFGQLSTYFHSLLAELHNKKNSLTAGKVRRQTTTLGDLAKKMENLKGLDDSHIDFGARIGVLKQVSGAPPQMKSTMEALERLDLQFTNHDAALSNVAADVVLGTKLFGEVVKGASKVGANVSGTGGKDDDDNTIRNALIGTVAGILLIGVIGAVTVFLVLRKKKGKKPHDLKLFDMTKLSKEQRTIAEGLQDAIQMKMERERLLAKKTEPKKSKLLDDLDEENGAKEIPAEMDVMIKTLRGKLGKKLADEVEESAKAEYNKYLAQYVNAKCRFVRSLTSADSEVGKNKVELFKKVKRTPLEMCREKFEWKKNADGILAPPHRSSEFCQFVIEMLLNYDTDTTSLQQFQLRLNDANAAVDEKQPQVAKNSGSSDIRCYEATRFKLTSGTFINASLFHTVYGGEFVICSSSSEQDAIEELIWQQKPSHFVTIDSKPFYTNHKPDSRFRVVMKSESVIFKCDECVIKEREVRVFGGPDDHHTITHYHISNMTHGGEIRTEKPFRDVVLKMVREMSRKPNTSAVFCDPDGGALAAGIAGIDLIASNLSHDGFVGVDVTTQLVNMLMVRGRMFKKADMVMFMVYLAVQVFLEDHDDTLSYEKYKVLEACSNARSKSNDSRVTEKNEKKEEKNEKKEEKNEKKEEKQEKEVEKPKEESKETNEGNAVPEYLKNFY